MRHISTSKRTQPGFTLVEMLIIAPIVILMIGGFVGLIITLTGDVLATNAKNKLMYDLQKGFDQISQDARLSTEFRRTSYVPGNHQSPSNNDIDFPFNTYRPFGVVSPAAPDPKTYPATPGDEANGPWFVLGTSLIFRTSATDKNPLDSTRKMVYSTSPDAGKCGTPDESENTPFSIDIVYYLQADGPNNFSMWRRVIHNPDQAPCPGKTPWQRPSCSPGITGGACQAEDQKVVGNIVSGGVSKYYASSPDRTTGDNPETPAMEGFLDCINPCYQDPANPSVPYDINNVYDPYSTSGVNAKAGYLGLVTGTTVAGRPVTAHNTLYYIRYN